MNRITHAFFVDDSGTKEYAEHPKQYGSGMSRHFVFGGLLMTTDQAARLTSQIISLKYNFFSEDDVEIKSNWLRRPKEREEHYLRTYNISNDNLNAFVEEYYSILQQAEMKLLASVIDKLHMQEDYGAKAWQPPAIAYEILLQRVENEMRQQNGIATVKIDDMTGATGAGNQYKANLKRHHEQMLTKGSALKSNFSFNHIAPRVKFADSSAHHLVQAADIVAYNVYRQFTDRPGGWEDGESDTLDLYEHLGKLSMKFRMGKNRRVQGYGIVKYPNRNRKYWAYIPQNEG